MLSVRNTVAVCFQSSLNKIDSLLQTKTNEMEKEKMVRKGFASVFASLQLSLGDDKVICSRPLSHFRTPGMDSMNSVLFYYFEYRI